VRHGRYACDAVNSHCINKFLKPEGIFEREREGEGRGESSNGMGKEDEFLK